MPRRPANALRPATSPASVPPRPAGRGGVPRWGLVGGEEPRPLSQTPNHNAKAEESGNDDSRKIRTSRPRQNAHSRANPQMNGTPAISAPSASALSASPRPAGRGGVPHWRLAGGEVFSPGQPLAPSPGLSGAHGDPRQFAYPAGYNIAQRPAPPSRPASSRSAPSPPSSTAFPSVSASTSISSVASNCVSSRAPKCSPRAKTAPATAGARPRVAFPPSSKAPTARKPSTPGSSPSSATCWRSTPSPSTRARPAAAPSTRSRLIAGKTIKPLLDLSGRAPRPPAPAYQQFLYGMPADNYTTGQLDYIRETSRTDSPYGLSRVERILLRVNQALRKQHFDLARFTDGVTPLGIIEPPDSNDWTPEQIETYERTFNGLLAGNDSQRVRAHMLLPSGAKWLPLSGDNPLIDFDRFLLNVTVAAFGLTMDDLGFAETSNRSTGQTQEAVISPPRRRPRRRPRRPGFLTRKVRAWLDPRFTVTFAGIEEPGDFALRADAFAKLIPLGVLTPAAAARLLHLPTDG